MTLTISVWNIAAGAPRDLRAGGARRPVSALASTLLVGALAIASPVFAHHSYAAFDITKQAEVKATVKSFLWTNPHSLLIVSATNADGTTTEYHIEMNGPGYLVRNGWKRDSLKEGDKVTVTMHPLRDGSPGGDLVKVVFPDGRTLATNALPPGFVLPPGFGGPGSSAPAPAPQGGKQ